MTAICTYADVYGYEVDCANTEPCSPDGVTTLYYLLPCTGAEPTMVEFCARYQDHPACPVTVEVGPPPVPPTLPATGLTGPVGALALIFAALGVALTAYSIRKGEPA